MKCHAVTGKNKLNVHLLLKKMSVIYCKLKKYKPQMSLFTTLLKRKTIALASGLEGV